MNKIGQIKIAPARSSLQQGTSQKSSVPVRLSAAQEAAVKVKAQTTVQRVGPNQPVDSIQFNSREFPTLEVITRQLLGEMYIAMDKALQAAEEEARVQEQEVVAQQQTEAVQAQEAAAAATEAQITAETESTLTLNSKSANTPAQQSEGSVSNFSTDVTVQSSSVPASTSTTAATSTTSAASSTPSTVGAASTGTGSAPTVQLSTGSVSIPQPTAPQTRTPTPTPAPTPAPTLGSGRPTNTTGSTKAAGSVPVASTDIRSAPITLPTKVSQAPQGSTGVVTGTPRQPERVPQPIQVQGIKNTTAPLPAEKSGKPLLRLAVDSVKQSTPVQLDQSHNISRSNILKS